MRASSSPAHHAVLFDFDGVLGDASCSIAIAAVQGLAALGVDLDVREYRRISHGLGGERWAAFIAEVCALRGRPIRDGDLELLQSEISRAAVESVRPVPGMCELWSRLKSPKAVVSSSPRLELVQKARQIGLTNVDDSALIGWEDVPRTKPFPEPYLLAAARTGVDPVHCVAVEDSASGIASAFDAGIGRVVLLTCCLDPTLIDLTALRKCCAPAHVARDAAHLGSLLRSWGVL